MLVQNQQKNLNEIIAKALSEPAFKERLKVEPKKVLSEMGVEIPKNVEIEVVESTSGKIYLTLPTPPSLDSLSDEEIETVASRMSTVHPCCPYTKAE